MCVDALAGRALYIAGARDRLWICVVLMDLERKINYAGLFNERDDPAVTNLTSTRGADAPLLACNDDVFLWFLE